MNELVGTTSAVWTLKRFTGHGLDWEVFGSDEGLFLGRADRVGILSVVGLQNKSAACDRRLYAYD